MCFHVISRPTEHAAHPFLISDEPDDNLVLVNDEPRAITSPHRLRYASYVRNGGTQYNKADEVPVQLRWRLLAVSGFDADAAMIGWELVEGRDLEAAIERQFAKSGVAYLHIHFAAEGRYAARVERS